MSDEPRITVGSGNIYADLGFEEPELEQTKAKLARQLGAIITSRGLTQVEAGRVLELDQSKVSALLRGRLGNFSTERLLRLLTRLGQDVDITVQPKSEIRSTGRIAVHYPGYGEMVPLVAAPTKKGKSGGVEFS